MQTVKKLISMLLVAVMLFTVVAACGSNNSGKNTTGTEQSSASSTANGQSQAATEQPTTAAEKEPVKLTVMSFMSDPVNMEIMPKLIEKFQKKYPYITVEHNPNVSATTQYSQVLKLAFDSGTAADVIYVDDLNQQMLQKYNYLMEITDVVKEKGWVEKQVPEAVEYCNKRTPGKFYSVPFVMAPVIMFYNRDIFSKAGINELPKTLDEFNAMLPKIKGAGYIPFEENVWNILWTIYNLVFGSVPMADIEKWYYRQETTPAFAEGFKGAVKQVDDWIKAGYFRKDLTSLNPDDNMTRYGQGKSAMVMDGDWSIKAYDDSKIPTGAFLLPPKDTSLPPAIVNAPYGTWAINAKIDPKKKEAAVEFINIFMDQDVIQMFYEGGFTPSVKFDTTKAITSPLKKELTDMVSKAQIGYYLDNTIPGLLDLIQKLTEELMMQKITPDQYWQKMDSKYQELIKAAK